MYIILMVKPIRTLECTNMPRLLFIILIDCPQLLSNVTIEGSIIIYAATLIHKTGFNMVANYRFFVKIFMSIFFS